MKTAFVRTFLVAATLAASVTFAGAQVAGGGPNGGGGNTNGGGNSSGKLDLSKPAAACPPTRACRSSKKPRRPRPVKVYGECRCDVTALETAGTITYRKTCYRYDDINQRYKICKL